MIQLTSKRLRPLFATHTRGHTRRVIVINCGEAVTPKVCLSVALSLPSPISTSFHQHLISKPRFPLFSPPAWSLNSFFAPLLSPLSIPHPSLRASLFHPPLPLSVTSCRLQSDSQICPLYLCPSVCLFKKLIIHGSKTLPPSPFFLPPLTVIAPSFCQLAVCAMR